MKQLGFYLSALILGLTLAGLWRGTLVAVGVQNRDNGGVYWLTADLASGEFLYRHSGDRR